MKIINTLLLVLIFLTGCQKEKPNKAMFLNNTIELFKNELPDIIIFYRDKYNGSINNTNSYIFLSSKELLDKEDENFYSVKIYEQRNSVWVNILSYKTGKSLKCEYDKSGKLISKDRIQAKLEPSKPYYIYYEILRRKYPDYMNWRLFPIPKDSLK
ncbi:hypothetical protein EGY05_22905 [Chryseobacterium arthrosphaerae]|uniref:hypothetical protein n=1 Tax=Chryseobacterium arthrosphaerae TaxID=651561 RepID=UPI000F4EB0A3|nr:hypothetical protein [Chryseobacterium arthrosphaerae]AYZ14597.1 hypothetical protein EGY05_22905 [Chryseobacterium arthrosphaerae]